MTALRSATLVSTLPLVAGLGMVVTTAWLVARKLALPTVTGLVLAAYLLGFAEIVAVTLLLSVTHSVLDRTVLVRTRWSFSLLCGSAWRLRHTAPRGFASRRLQRGAQRVPRPGSRACWGLVSSAGFAYSAALAVFTPPTTGM